MCQCLPCDCWWCNCFGICGGFASLQCCWGYWCCKPDEMNRHNSACCYCCESSGLGSNFFCYGMVCCAPTWLQTYAKVATGKMPQQQFGQPMQQGYGQPMQQGYGQPMHQGYGNGPQIIQAGGATVVRM